MIHTIWISGKYMRKITQKHLQVCMNFGVKKWLKRKAIHPHHLSSRACSGVASVEPAAPYWKLSWSLAQRASSGSCLREPKQHIRIGGRIYKSTGIPLIIM